MADSITFVTRSTEETKSLGSKLGKRLRAGDLLCLVGEVGSGKTTFVKGLAQGLGVHEEVQSPTFVLIHEYAGRIPLAHMDFYRLSLIEILGLGWEDYLRGSGAVVIEWADIGQSLWPKDYLEIRFKTQHENTRELILTPAGKRSDHLIQQVKKRKI